MNTGNYPSISTFHAAAAKNPVGYAELENRAMLVFLGCLPPKTLADLNGFAGAVDLMAVSLPEDYSERIKDPLYERLHRVIYWLAMTRSARNKNKEVPTEAVSLLPFFDRAIESVASAIHDRTASSINQSRGYASSKEDAYHLAGCACLAWAFQKYGIPDFGG
jgi:hypothetical protein